MEFGLLAGGAVSKSLIARIPRLPVRLGPVVSSSLRVASRTVNSLGAGFAARDCEAFEECRVVLICLPDRNLQDAIGRLTASRVNWVGKTAVLCGSCLDSSRLSPLRDRGSSIASLSLVENAPGWFAIEGHRTAANWAKRLVRELNGKVLQFNTSQSDLYWAGTSLATNLFVPLIAASIDCFRGAGCDTSTASAISQALFQNSLKSYVTSGRSVCRGPRSKSAPEFAARLALELMESRLVPAGGHRAD